MFKCVSGDSTSVPMPCGASSGILAGDMVCFDVTNNVVIVATASLLNENIAGIAISDAPAAAGFVDIIPIRDQLWEWDCTNATAADQLCQRSLLTDCRTVANTTTEQAVDEITVIPIQNFGTSKQRGLVGAGRNTAAVS